MLYKFGEMLNSRPSGRDAYLSAKAYVFDKNIHSISFDFTDIKVLAPSWIDEFINLLRYDYPAVKIKFLHSDNPSVNASLKMLAPTASL